MEISEMENKWTTKKHPRKTNDIKHRFSDKTNSIDKLLASLVKWKKGEDGRHKLPIIRNERGDYHYRPYRWLKRIFENLDEVETF